MLPSTDELSRLLGTLYDAASEPALWDEFLRQLASTTRSRSAALVMHDFRQHTHSLSKSWAFDPAALSRYQEHYGSMDVWAKRGVHLPAGYACTSQSLCPLEELHTTEFYNDYMKFHEFEHGMFGVIESGGPRVAAVSLFRDASLPEFGESDLYVLRFLAPHVRRAFRLHFQFSQLKARRAEIGTALDLVAVGIILLGPKGEIVLMNRAASQFVAANDGLMALHQGLRAERPTESAGLERLIAEAAGTSLGKGLEPAGAMSVSRKKGLPLHILLTPVRNLKVEGHLPVCAVAFIHDPSQQARPLPCILHDLFGLTPAESRVALLLADGRTPKEIAKRVSVSTNTMKSHLSAIYGKTSTSGQVQLVRLLTQLSLPMPPLDRSSA